MSVYPVSRRDLLCLSAAGVLGGSVSGWLEPLARAAAPGLRRKACILLWMDGGPSHIDTFDPKPDAPANVRGEFKAIATSVAGVHVSERFPKLARLMRDLAIVRSLNNDEADHARARVHVHTGYKPGAGGVVHPTLGATVSAELGRPDAAMPNFVVTGAALNKHGFLADPGYRGPRHQPLALADPSKGVENLAAAVPADEFDDRVALLDLMEHGFTRSRPAAAAAAHQTNLSRALRLMRSDRTRAFDLSREPAATRRLYGEGSFGQGCLLARRLVEAGVPFVEVYLQNWDTHDRRTADAARGLMTQVDDAMAALIGDLKQRGLLDSTLVVWTGEFGRTPTINRNGGRDHWARAWSAVLAGGGVRGGRVVGKTDRTGSAVTERPVSVKDFLATVCRALGIDHTRSILTPIGRPVRIVEKGERVVTELF